MFKDKPGLYFPVKVAHPPHPQLFRSMLKDKPALYFPVKVSHPRWGTLSCGMGEETKTEGWATRPDKVAHATGLFWTKQHGVFAAAGIVSITENLARIVDSDGVGQRKTGAGRNESIEID
jgi:hypothetical protein